jgi:hypothetical protein
MLIQAVKIFFGRAASLDLAIFPAYLAVLLLIKASMFGIEKHGSHFIIFYVLLSNMVPSNM